MYIQVVRLRSSKEIIVMSLHAWQAGILEHLCNVPSKQRIRASIEPT